MASSARYEQRQLLDQLMGSDLLRSRNGHNNNYRQREPEITDHQVCKNYIMGLCPYELFQGTKQDMGTCKKLHSEKFRIQYDREVEEGKDFSWLELEVLDRLHDFLELNNYNIKTAMKALDNESNVQDDMMRKQINAETENLAVAESNVNITIQEIKKLNELGEIEKSLQLMDKLKEYKVKRDFHMKELRKANDSLTQSLQQKLQVCTKCSAYLSRLDSDKRLADHFLGKIHLNYVKLRDRYQELSEKYSK
ncbi:hypothetical protein WICPIJ_005964 [Wickerhamomyces pijperi]|uniref:Uncharacterized protein n=1 Tax=Wickerhamomyces pijperi TaxID=599730 RepID=A0A9P8Q4L9_WICPI|nr:hypothetical protein WICPIJ_005964 [Wickerhamomyces pijperi]